MYKAKITKQGEAFYALIVRVDSDETENVIHGYSGRFFKTIKGAERSTANYIKKYNLNG